MHMYGQGNNIPQVLAACTGVAAACAGAAVLPQTGADTAISIAVAAAAGLATWAAVYVSAAKFGNR
jgi:LPXTG-motif cell wall-anchored protein